MKSLVCTLALVSTAAAQDLPANWKQLHIENRWLHYRRGTAEDAEEKGKWIQFFSDNRDYEMLEWIAIYDFDPRGGPNPPSAARFLQLADAEQWLRTAAWYGRHSKPREIKLPVPGQMPDSHTQDDAIKLLVKDAGTFLGWFERHPGGSNRELIWLVKALRRKGLEPDDAGANYLPPLDPTTTLLALLTAPKNVAELGLEEKPEPGKRYAHQVARGIRGLVGSGIRDSAYLRQLLRLTTHDHDSVRREAYLAYTSIGARYVPFDTFEAITRDDEAKPLDRELATMAMSYSDHPGAFTSLHELLQQPDHPGHAVALSRLAETGWGATRDALAILVPNGRRYARAHARIKERLKNASQKYVAKRTTKQLERAAWAALEGGPAGVKFAERTVEYLTSLTGDGRKFVQKRARQAIAGYAPREGLVADPMRLTQKVRELAARLRKQ